VSSAQFKISVFHGQLFVTKFHNLHFAIDGVATEAVAMAFRNLAKKVSGKRFKGHQNNESTSSNTDSNANNKNSDLPPLPLKSAETDTNLVACTNPDSSFSQPSGIPRGPSSTSYTRARFLWFDDEFTSALRKKSKSEGTTVASVLVVAALAAVRSSFSTLPNSTPTSDTSPSSQKNKKKPSLPSRQGWVVTTSVRHLLPQSKLLQGGERQTDEALKIFGGYAGSVTNASLKITDSSDVWERSRSVRKSIAMCYRASIQRMQLMNYCYRHPKLWKKIASNVDLSKLSRSYSVEVANLGAWDWPCGAPDAPASDARIRLEHFAGAINASFDGVRGLFTLGVITVGGNMSVAVCYNSGSIFEEEAETFCRSFSEGLQKMKDSKGKTTVLQVRT
jgi:hypothetical protein